MRKPNFSDYWGKGKTPTLQIRILKSLVLYGKISITRASILLDSNDSDISDAMHELSQHRKFVEYSDSDTSSRNPEKFYKITEKGLKSLLVIDGLSPEEFWKVITLLCIVSKEQMSQSQLEDYYAQFEKDLLGYSASIYFSRPWLFDKIIQEWMQDNDTNSSLVSISQVVMECLALHRSLTPHQLVKETGLKEKNIINVLDKYSIPIGSYKKKAFTYSVSSFLIIAKKSSMDTTYELSLFGVMLVIAFIRNNHLGVNSWDKSNDKNRRQNLFYKNNKMEEYYDKIAYNHKEKLPNIFNKWSILKSQLGSLLYDNLDFLIYKKARSNITDKSVWFGGNKEFYEDVQSIVQNAYQKLSLVHIQGKEILQYYQDQQYQYKLVPVNSKLFELDKKLFYTSQSHYENKSQQLDLPIDYVNGLEDLFKDEVTFFFYLNLNSFTFSASIDCLSLTPGQIFQMHYANELSELGSPKQRLMALLTQDKDIKQWFSKRLDDVLNYRKQISGKMVGFCNDVSNPQENVKKEKISIQKLGRRPASEPLKYEYNIAKICSAIQSLYDY